MQIDLARERLNQVLSSCQQLENENQALQQKVLAMTTIQEKCKVLEDRKEKLKQEILILETHMAKNMIDRRQAEMLKQEIKERSRRKREETLEKISQFLQVNIIIFQCSFFIASSIFNVHFT